MELARLEELVGQLVRIGAALASERDLRVLLEMIVDELRRFTRADGGTLFLVDEAAGCLRWAIIQNDSLGVRVGGSGGEAVDEAVFAPLPMEPGQRVHAAVHVALTGEPVNIADVYDRHDDFDFTGPMRFDEAQGYRTRSMLVVPVAHFEGGVVGVLQLINAQEVDGALVPFSARFEALTTSLASQAAVAIKNAQLVGELEAQFEAFIRMIAAAIDAKSPYTAGHVRRVEGLAMRLARAVAEDQGVYGHVRFDEAQLKELSVAAWMHDVGKIATPEHVVDKATKLHALTDRIERVRVRYALLAEQTRAAELQRQLDGQPADPARVAAELDALDEEFLFIERVNAGAEYVPPADIARLHAIGQKRWTDARGTSHPRLEPDEIRHLSVTRGTLTDDERDVIRDHARISIEMLEHLPFSSHLKDVPAIAGAHHEKLNGQGYPRGLTGEQLSLRARILAVADIVEALTAADRPYKKPMAVSEVHRILGFMVRDDELDGELVRFAMRAGVLDAYVEDEVAEAQRDAAFAALEAAKDQG